MTQNFKFGALPSPHDYRDYPVSAFIAKTFPKEYIPKRRMKVRNQGNVGACVAYGISTAKSYQEYRERKLVQDFSANFIYGNRLDEQYQGEGMYPREALKMLKGYGVCEEYLMPGIWNYPKQKELFNEDIRLNALPQRIEAYAAINSVDELKTTIYEHKAALVVFPVYETFSTYKGGKLPMPGTQEQATYYHLVAAIGYTNDTILIQNSWGENWGEGGFCNMPTEYPFSEKWAMFDANHMPQGFRRFDPEKDFPGWESLTGLQRNKIAEMIKLMKL